MILMGGCVPYIARPRDDKFREPFQLLGSAYVHGAMHGEVLNELDERYAGRRDEAPMYLYKFK